MINKERWPIDTDGKESKESVISTQFEMYISSPATSFDLANTISLFDSIIRRC